MLLKKKYVATAPSTFYPIGTKLIIEGQEFAAQSRTLLFLSEMEGKFSHYIKFPKTHFCKYSFLLQESGLPYDMFCYTITGYVDNEPVYLCLPDVTPKLGLVGLGKDMGQDYLSKKEIDLDDFIERFWLSRFNGNEIKNYNLENIVFKDHLIFSYPHLWAQDLPKGWELYED